VASGGLEGLGVKVHGAPERPVGGASVQGAYDSDLGRESTEVSHSGAGSRAGSRYGPELPRERVAANGRRWRHVTGGGGQEWPYVAWLAF